MRGLGDIQVAIMRLCEEDEAPRATFSVAAMRQQLATDREVLRCDMKGFRLSFRRALEGLVRRRHLVWGDKKRTRVRRGPVQPVLPGLTKQETRDFLELVKRELARKDEPEEEEDVKDYLTDEPKAVNPVHELQRIATYSCDFGARLAAIRRLAQWLGDSDPHRPRATEAKWKVIRIAPGSPGHRDYKPPEAVNGARTARFKQP